jgi:hypothetical protein
MKTVRDQPSPRSPGSRGNPVETAPVPADNLNAGITCQPRCGGHGRSVPQQGDAVAEIAKERLPRRHRAGERRIFRLLRTAVRPGLTRQCQTLV